MSHSQAFTRELTERQQACLRGVLEMKSAKEIGRDLGVTHHAVEKHLKLAREKLGAATTVEAARIFAARDGTVAPDYGRSDLQNLPNHSEEACGLDWDRRSAPLWFEDVHAGAFTQARPLSPSQTLMLIGLVSMSLVVVLLLLIACAEGIKSIVVP